MARMFPRMSDVWSRVLHELGNGRAVENARREREEHDILVARIDALLVMTSPALPAAA